MKKKIVETSREKETEKSSTKREKYGTFYDEKKEKKIEYVAITKKALVFEQLLKKEQGKMGELKSAFKDHYINAGKDNYASTGEN